MTEKKAYFKDTASYYDFWHEAYKKHYGSTFQAHRPEDIAELHNYLFSQIGFKDSERVLDAGCGICGPAISFAEKCLLDIEALTNSKKQFDDALGFVKNSNLKGNINITLGDFNNLDKIFPSEYFDRIYFLESFGHSKNKKKTIHTAWNVLKQNGYLYIKDYFKTEITGSVQRKKIMTKAINSMNREYSYELSDLYDTLKILRQLDSKLIFLNAPKYSLSNEKAVIEFEKENNIDLFCNEYMPIIVEPLELMIQKTNRDVRIS